MNAKRFAHVPLHVFLIVFLALSLALLTLKLLNPSRIYVVTESGGISLQEIQLFTSYDLLAAFAVGLASGISATLLLVEVRRKPQAISAIALSPDVLPTLNLSELERKILEILLNNGGKMYQWDLAKKLGVSKSTLSVTLKKLQAKGIIERRKVGIANMVILKNITS